MCMKTAKECTAKGYVTTGGDIVRLYERAWYEKICDGRVCNESMSRDIVRLYERVQYERMCDERMCVITACMMQGYVTSPATKVSPVIVSFNPTTQATFPGPI